MIHSSWPPCPACQKAKVGFSSFPVCRACAAKLPPESVAAWRALAGGCASLDDLQPLRKAIIQHAQKSLTQTA
jgi:hypothetical protein